MLQDDKTVWETIGPAHRTCRYKFHTKTALLCTNKNNMHGYCRFEYCPLAQSRYATVVEKDRKIYLRVREPERVHLPRFQYEDILLPESPETARLLIEENLPFWLPENIQACYDRYLRLSHYVARMNTNKEQYRRYHLSRRLVKDTRRREYEVLEQAHIRDTVREVVLARYNAGLYADLRENTACKETRRKTLEDYESEDAEIESLIENEKVYSKHNNPN